MPPERIVLTAQPEAAVIALNEIQKLDPAARPLEALNAEARLVSVPGGYAALMERLRSTRVIFVRHLFPVQHEGALPLAEAPPAEAFAFLPERGAAFDRPFAVQMRVHPKDDALFAQALAYACACEDLLRGRGFLQDDRNPAWVVSLFVKGNRLYAGVSDCVQNRSAWSGGAARYKKEPGFVGRAEFKLLEAFEIFNLRTPIPGLNALDLGAAPGGWSKVLLEAGYRVTAVDPAAMAASVCAHPGLTHICATAQRFNASGQTYDLIVNDMRMDIYESCRIMLDFHALLNPGGAAIMTFKLTPGHWYQKTVKALALLEQKYHAVDARQLFHNRDEVTVYMEG